VSERLTRSAGIIGIATLASRLLGLVRDVIQGAYFATGPMADAFVLATRIPTLLRDLFAEGAMSAAFVPTFTRYLTTDGKAAAWRLGAQVINALLVVTGILVVLGVVFAEPIATAFAEPFRFQAPGFSAGGLSKLDLTVLLTRLNMPFLLLVAVAAACMGMLNALHRFFIPSLAPALYNVIFIVCAITLTPVFTRAGLPPIMSLTTGMLLGGVVQIVSQWPSLWREGYRHQWVLNPRDKGLHEVLVLMGPGTLGVAAAQINVFVNTVLAVAHEGAPTALSFAFRFMYLPVGIFGVSVATAAIPVLARYAAEGKLDDMRHTISWALRLMFVLSIPACVGLMVLAEPVVEMIYRFGHFGADSVALVAPALFFYSPGIIGYSIVKIASPSFYALRDARTPVIISVIAIVTNLVLNLALNWKMGFIGLALGTAIAANVNALILLVLLSRRLNGLDASRVLTTVVKTLIASAVMGVVAYYTERVLHGMLPDSNFLHRFLRVFGAIGAGIVTLIVSAWILRIDELRQAVGRLIRRPTA